MKPRAGQCRAIQDGRPEVSAWIAYESLVLRQQDGDAGVDLADGERDQHLE